MIRTHVRALMFAAVTAIPLVAFAAAPDSVVTVVSARLAVGSGEISPFSAISAFTYDAANQIFWVSGTTGINQQLRRIDDLAAGSYTVMMADTAWRMFDRGGDLTRGGGTPIPSGMLFNPVQIGSTPAYGGLWFTDATGNVTQSSVVQPAISQKLYRYNLARDSAAGDTQPGDGRNEFTSLITLSTVQAALSSTNNSTNVGRQFAWSGDGQKVYWLDSSTIYGGFWKMNAADGTGATRIYANPDVLVEPAVTSSGGVDSIYFENNNSSTLTTSGGIDKITHDGTTTSAVISVVSKAVINDFLEYGAADAMSILQMCTDADGNIYFNNGKSGGTFGDRRGLFKLDTAGRLSKVAGYLERQGVFFPSSGTPNNNMQRMQTRTATFGTGSTAFSATQVMYQEASGINAVAGAFVLKVGDFNRDNAVTQADIALFKPELTPRLQAVTLANADKLKFDLNGSNSIDWKDVKILQQFYAFRDGDANIDQLVDSTDFNALVSGYGKLTAALWTEGDFDGDQKVTTTDFNILAGNFGLAPTPVPGDSLGAVVPEPATISVVALCGLAMVAWRRR